MTYEERLSEFNQNYENKMLASIGEIWYFQLTNGLEVVAKIVLPLPMGFVVEYPAKIYQTVYAENEAAPPSIKTMFSAFANKFTDEKDFILSNDKIMCHGKTAPELAKFYLNEFHRQVISALEKVQEEETPTVEDAEMDKTIEDLRKQGKVVSFVNKNDKAN